MFDPPSPTMSLYFFMSGSPTGSSLAPRSMGQHEDRPQCNQKEDPGPDLGWKNAATDGRHRRSALESDGSNLKGTIGHEQREDSREPEIAGTLCAPRDEPREDQNEECSKRKPNQA